MNKQIKNKPYWTDVIPAPAQFPWLDHNVSCDVAIMGGGIAGAFCVQQFSNAGIHSVLLSDNPVAYGATSSAQGVISYQLEGGLLRLSKKIGMDNAVKIYSLCAKTVDDLENLDAELEMETEFLRKDCFYYTSDKESRNQINQEFLARKHNGFTVEIVEGEPAREMFSFPIESGILSTGMAAECNPYKLTHALIRSAVDSGAKVFENTAVTEIEGNAQNGYTLRTEDGKQVRAKRVILAAGTETARHLPTVTSTRTTFSLVTAPVGDFNGWHNRSLICSDDHSAVRLRTTPDNRIIISGLDCGMIGINRLMGKLNLNSLPEKKYNELEKTLQTMFPGIHEMVPEYAYSYNYAATHDALPVIGCEQQTGIYYALCTGENGIAFAKIAADMLLEQHQGAANPDINLFSLVR